MLASYRHKTTSLFPTLVTSPLPTRKKSNWSVTSTATYLRTVGWNFFFLTEQRIDCSAWTPTPATDGGIRSEVRVRYWRNVVTDTAASRSFGAVIFSAGSLTSSRLLELAVASVYRLPAGYPLVNRLHNSPTPAACRCAELRSYSQPRHSAAPSARAASPRRERRLSSFPPRERAATASLKSWLRWAFDCPRSVWPCSACWESASSTTCTRESSPTAWLPSGRAAANGHDWTHAPAQSWDTAASSSELVSTPGWSNFVTGGPHWVGAE